MPVVPVRRVIRAVSRGSVWQRSPGCPAENSDSTLPVAQLWILLAVATLSMLPYMVFEFQKASFALKYQGGWRVAAPA